MEYTYDEYLKDQGSPRANGNDDKYTFSEFIGENDSDIRNWLKSFYTGQQKIEDIPITPKLRERYERQATTESAAPPKLNLLEQAVTTPIALAGAGVAGVGGEVKLAGGILNRMAQTPGAPVPSYMAHPEFKEGATRLGEKIATTGYNLAENIGPENKDVKDVVMGIGESFPGLAKYMATAALGHGNFAFWGAISGLLDAADRGDSEIKGLLKGGTEGAIQDAIFRYAHKVLPTSKLGRMAATGTGFVGGGTVARSIEESIEQGKPKIVLPTLKEAAKEFATGVGVAGLLPGGNKKSALDDMGEIKLDRPKPPTVPSEKPTSNLSGGVEKSPPGASSQGISGEKQAEMPKPPDMGGAKPKVEITTADELAKQLPPPRKGEATMTEGIDAASFESGLGGKNVGRTQFVELEKVGENWKPVTHVTKEGDVGVGRTTKEGQRVSERKTVMHDPQTGEIVDAVFKAKVDDPKILEAFKTAETGGVDKPVSEVSIGDTFGEQFKTGKFKAEPPAAPPPKTPPPPSGPGVYEPKMKTSGPAKDIWKKAVEKGLVDKDVEPNLPQYEAAVAKEFANRTVDYIGGDIARGWDVLEGKTNPPPGTSVSSFFLAMKHHVDTSGSGQDLIRFARSKGLVKLSEAGSTLGQVSGYKQEDTPTNSTIKIVRSRQKGQKELKESPFAERVLVDRVKITEKKLKKAIEQDDTKRKELAEKRLKLKLKKFNDQVENDPQYRKKFFDEFERVRTEMNKSPEPNDYKIIGDISLGDFVAAINGKRIGRYRNIQEKKISELTDRILRRNFASDPKFKTWLDTQTRASRERVRQLQKTFKKLKDMSDRRAVGISDEEAQNIMNKYNEMRQKKEAVTDWNDRSENGLPREYGRAKVDYDEYVGELQHQAIKPTMREALRMPLKTAIKGGGLSKAIIASFDNSYIFRQGFKTLVSHPLTWASNAKASWGWGVKQFGRKHVMREIMADIVSRPNYPMMERMGKGKFFGNPEEPFPTPLPEKWPVIGRVYKTSETMFAGQAYKTRADLADKFIEMSKNFEPNPILKKLFPKTDFGPNLNDKRHIESIGKLIGSLTGRGDIGNWGESKGELINNLFFSLRFFKSNLDFLTAHQFQKKVTPFVRVEAAKNLMKAVGVTAAVLTIANALKPGSIEKDPRSANFGKIKIGNTRFDVTGGMGSIVTLAFRLIRMSTKSATTGRITELNTGKFMGRTGKDVIQEFVDGKLSPAASVIWNSLLGGRDKTTRGKPTVVSTVKNLIFPMPLQNLEELLGDPNSANIVAAIIADGLGIGVNTYGKKMIKTKWKELDYFKNSPTAP